MMEEEKEEENIYYLSGSLLFLLIFSAIAISKARTMRPFQIAFVMDKRQKIVCVMGSDKYWSEKGGYKPASEGEKGEAKCKWLKALKTSWTWRLASHSSSLLYLPDFSTFNFIPSLGFSSLPLKPTLISFFLSFCHMNLSDLLPSRFSCPRPAESRIVNKRLINDLWLNPCFFLLLLFFLTNSPMMVYSNLWHYRLWKQSCAIISWLL